MIIDLANIPRIVGIPREDLPFPLGGMLKYDGVGVSLGIEIAYWKGPKRLRVGVSSDATPHGKLLHVSMSYPDHDPSWEIIKAVRGIFFPDTLDVMMMLPKQRDYINVDQHCFHLWQTPKGWNIQ